jgi:hypothetical protein
MRLRIRDTIESLVPEESAASWALSTHDRQRVRQRVVNRRGIR